MKSMQRRFGGLMKRSADQADVGAVLADFKAADEMLDRLIQNLVTWRDSWEDILKLQYDGAEALAKLYKPVEPTQDPEMRHQPAKTPAKYLQKCLGLQKLYAEVRGDLAQEIGMINTKLVRPAEQAKQAIKGLHKTLKHRENTKLDYERYLGRAEHARKKENRSMKEETALAKYESDLTQAEIDYQTADEQVKLTFPPVTDALVSLMPYLLTNLVMLQTTLVGQLYTVLDAYCRQQGLPSPAPADADIINTWDREFTSLRQELESGLKLVAQGKAVHLAMNLPDKDKSTVSGLGLRNKYLHRNKSDQPLPQHKIGAGTTSLGSSDLDDEEEAPPSKPPRPGASPSPRIPASSKPRIPSGNPSPYLAPYDHRAVATIPSYPGDSSYDQPPTPGSNYHTPPSGGTPTPLSLAVGNDYFAARQRQPSSSSLSTTSSAAIAKKKPPPPIPVKRVSSAPLPQYVTALYDFEGQNDGDLAFREGDRIRVVRKTDSTDDWWDGELRGVQGTFPANYVQV